ncbi:hypothetical protein [Nocardioides panacisoli]|uniref:Integral membrane protein n=1 Tax=Nocardioides panacisoli TaxID=627624 RepID=A0ABP7IZN9_9ACTN
MRGALAATLVLVATILSPFAITAVWLSSTADSTDAYVDTVAPLADDPTLRAELANRMSQAAVAELQQRLPVAVPDGIDEMTGAAARQVVADSGFPDFWREANRDAHREFLRVMNEHGGNPNGWVTVDLSPLMVDVYQHLGDATGLPVAGIPTPELRVPVARESQLAKYRTAYRVLDGAGLVLAVTWVLLVGLAALVARGWRGRLRAIGVAALGLAVGGLLVRVGTPPVVHALAHQADPGQRALVQLILGVVGDSLRSRATMVAVAAAVVGLGLVVVTLLPGRRTSSAQSWG